MKTKTLRNSTFFSAAFLLMAAGGMFAQTPKNVTKNVNFAYSQNPKTKTKKDSADRNAAQVTTDAESSPVSDEETPPPNESIAFKTLEVVKSASKRALAPTETYKIGIGDVLFISLRNASKGSTYFTVLNDGTVDYPLAGEMIAVAGLTTDEVEEILREKVKLYENPQIAVKIRDYASHKITVLGLVERPGERFIQREAVPLYVVRADAVVQSEATRVVIRRPDSTTETYSLNDEKSENTLIFPDDIVEFTGAPQTASQSGRAGYFYIGGAVGAGGQKDFYSGMTLSQAILASGGLRRESVKKVVIRRKNAAGILVSSEFNLKSIKDGKIPDPVLEAGDTIEVGN